jgi:hypothetical protein
LISAKMAKEAGEEREEERNEEGVFILERLR